MWLWDKGKAGVWLCGLLILDEASGRPARVRIQHALSTLSFSPKTRSFWSQKDAPFLLILLSISTHAFLFDNLGKQNETSQHNLVARDDFSKRPNLSRSILSRHIIRAVVTLSAHCSCEQQRIEPVGISEREKERRKEEKAVILLDNSYGQFFFFLYCADECPKKLYLLRLLSFHNTKNKTSERSIIGFLNRVLEYR